MVKKRKSECLKPQQLLVEGTDDRHVIWSLRQKYNVPENFSVELPDETETTGVEALLSGLTVRLKEPNLETLGIVVDADKDLQARWQAISNKLTQVGYQNIPTTPTPKGWIDTQPELPKIGIWIMPNNELSGMLEDFVAYLISPEDI